MKFGNEQSSLKEQSKCLDYNGTSSTFEGYGFTNFTLKYNLNETENLEVNYTFKSGIENIQFNNSYEFDFEENNDLEFSNTITIVILFFIFFCVLFFIKMKPRKRKKY